MTQVQRLQRIQQTLDRLVEKLEKPVFVKVSFIRSKTGWTKEKLRQAREQGLVEYEKRDDGLFYDIKSIDPVFFIK